MGWPEMTSSLARESVHHTRSATAAQEHRATLARLAAVLRDPTGDEVNPTSFTDVWHTRQARRLGRRLTGMSWRRKSGA
jgi:hypothetical protein